MVLILLTVVDYARGVAVKTVIMHTGRRRTIHREPIIVGNYAKTERRRAICWNWDRLRLLSGPQWLKRPPSVGSNMSTAFRIAACRRVGFPLAIQAFAFVLSSPLTFAFFAFRALLFLPGAFLLLFACCSLVLTSLAFNTLTLFEFAFARL